MSFFQFLVQASDAQHIADSLKQKAWGDIMGFISLPVDDQFHKVSGWLIDFAFKLALCLVLIWVGKKLINFVTKLLRKIMTKRKVDVSVSHFLTNLLRAIFWVVLVWILIDIMGANTSSFVALFASAGLAFGLALSGTLQNFAGGIMILLFKPFRIGDFIETQGVSGTVADITITNTIITTPDNKTIYLPNGATSSGVINNYSQQPNRRVEWVFGIGYGDDYDNAKKILMRQLKDDKRILTDPEPFIALKELGQSSVNIVVRAWVVSADFWPVYFDLNEKVYKEFPEVNLSIPFPQMDVYLHQSDEARNSLISKGK